MFKMLKEMKEMFVAWGMEKDFRIGMTAAGLMVYAFIFGSFTFFSFFHEPDMALFSLAVMIVFCFLVLFSYAAYVLLANSRRD